MINQNKKDKCVICKTPSKGEFCEFHKQACEIIGKHKFYKMWGVKKIDDNGS